MRLQTGERLEVLQDHVVVADVLLDDLLEPERQGITIDNRDALCPPRFECNLLRAEEGLLEQVGRLVFINDVPDSLEDDACVELLGVLHCL